MITIRKHIVKTTNLGTGEEEIEIYLLKEDVLKLIDEMLETTEYHEPPTLQELKARIEG